MSSEEKTTSTNSDDNSALNVDDVGTIALHSVSSKSNDSAGGATQRTANTSVTEVKSIHIRKTTSDEKFLNPMKYKPLKPKGKPDVENDTSRK
ncbi:hypothetical protein SNEBB_000015 [Seison nebaliae]|nr:hypothetical protein SNEBB_000015 [Seison nebaliae]